MIPFAMSLFVRKNVVIMGGRLHGCQTAEYLLHLGRNITIVDEGHRKGYRRRAAGGLYEAAI